MAKTYMVKNNYTKLMCLLSYTKVCFLNHLDHVYKHDKLRQMWAEDLFILQFLTDAGGIDRKDGSCALI